MTDPRAADQPSAEDPRQKGRLFFASFLMLFTELALIRWITANNVYVTEATNFVLLASFLGIGIGFLNARSGRDYLRWAPVALLVLVGFVLTFPVVLQVGPTPFRGIGHIAALPKPLSFGAVFLLTVGVMAGLGQAVARVFVGFRPLSAYRLDILGSITGIAAFSALSFIDAQPWAWGLIAAVVLALLYGRRIGVIQVVALLGVAGMLGAESLSSADVWSPYYRLTVVRHGSNFIVNANGVPHQVIQPTDRRSRFYYFPYQQSPHNRLRHVLVIGAGTGNDIATALAEGARHVDAVEIDPELHRLGQHLNPDHPYQSPRVSVYIDDGRAFLQQTTTRYDMILFALPDSLTLVSGQSSLRLESYLFTLQAMQTAKAHLRPSGGVFAMYNYYRTSWLRNRLANTLDVIYGHAPCIATDAKLSMLTISPDRSALTCRARWHRPASVLAPATDDHPFVYLDGNQIPGYYLLTLGLILAASVISVRVFAGRLRRMGGYVDLFFMGAAFLLLETKSLVQFALLFGTTWFVNALVFAGVLVAVLAAVEVSRRVKVRQPAWLYLLLLAALTAAWSVPTSALLGLPLAARFGAAAALAFAPVFMANLVFAQRFRDTGDSSLAFGANLLGSMVGGVLEYTSLIFGYRWLLVLVAALYGLAFLTSRLRGSAGVLRAPR